MIWPLKAPAIQLLFACQLQSSVVGKTDVKQENSTWWSETERQCHGVTRVWTLRYRSVLNTRDRFGGY